MPKKDQQMLVLTYQIKKVTHTIVTTFRGDRNTLPASWIKHRTYMSKLKVEFNYSTIASAIQLFNYCFSYSTIQLFNYSGEGRGRS